MNKTTLFALVLMLLTPLLAFTQVTQTENDDIKLLGPELDKTQSYNAVLQTSLGTIVLELFPDQAPMTVRNFVNLIEGTKPWKDPKTGVTEQKPYYDGIVFHRVIKGFMIQGGDPTGTGRGGPGFRFKDEFDKNLDFTRMDYVLAMANAGAGTNGSQFFITDKGSRPGHLNGKHTIFGKVIEGQEVVDAIAASPKENPPVIVKATVVRSPKVPNVEGMAKDAVKEKMKPAEDKMKSEQDKMKAEKDKMKQKEAEAKGAIPAVPATPAVPGSAPAVPAKPAVPSASEAKEGAKGAMKDKANKETEKQSKKLNDALTPSSKPASKPAAN